MQYTSFKNALIHDVDFHGADLCDARMEKARISGADFRGADIRWTHLPPFYTTKPHRTLWEFM
jgi:uncharacterized protein YjbI with pentapeptide repeats